MPGDVLSIEGLGSALGGTQPARIVRWVALPASKRTPPARAAQQLVPSRPLAFGFALLRRACICFEQAVTSQSVARTSTDSAFLQPSKTLGSDRNALVACFGAGIALRLEIATNQCGRALAASEAGRTAQTRLAHVRDAKSLNDLDMPLCCKRCLTFEMRGGARLAG